MENFTTYTEFDNNNHINLVGTNHIDSTVKRNEDAYLYDDKGAAHFTDFTHDFALKAQDLHAQALSIGYMLANTVDDWYAIWGANGVHIAVSPQKFSGISNRNFVLYAKPTGGLQYDVTGQLSIGVWYYFRMVKLGTALNCGIYSTALLRDAGDGTDGDVDNLTLTFTVDQDFRYVYAVNTRNDGNTYQSDVDIEDLELNEVVAPTVIERFQEEGTDFRETKYGATY